MNGRGAFAAQFPNWIVFSPGMAPIFAVAVTTPSGSRSVTA
jgi:hypothetical protein